MFHTEQVNRSHYWGIFLVGFSILILEITLTKIFSVTLWYHFSYLVISLAMFGVGFGGLLVYKVSVSYGYSFALTLGAIAYFLAFIVNSVRD